MLPTDVGVYQWKGKGNFAPSPHFPTDVGVAPTVARATPLRVSGGRRKAPIQLGAFRYVWSRTPRQWQQVLRAGG